MAVAAHWEEAAEGSTRSREPRRRLLLETSGATGSGSATSVLIHNISATGLLIESPAPLVVGERIEIDLPHAGACWARVVWASERLFGCQFDAAISQATLSAAQLRGSVAQSVEIAPVAGESFGVRLQRLRKERGLTLSQIGAALGVSKPTVWAWEQGKARPAIERWPALAEMLGVSEADLQPMRRNEALDELLVRTREQIARAVGTGIENVRIMIEL